MKKSIAANRMAFAVAILFCFAVSQVQARPNRAALIGNSMITAVDSIVFLNQNMKNGEAFLKRRSLTTADGVDPSYTAVNGPKSAFAFAVVHNQASRTDADRPGYVVVMTRLNDETTPNSRIYSNDCDLAYGTKYKGIIDAVVGKTNPKLRSILDSVAYNDSLKNLFTTNKGVFGYGGTVCDTNKLVWEFSKANPLSFLPRMVSVCKANDVKLIILLHKVYEQAQYSNYWTLFPARDKYRKDMAEYLQKNGMHLLDYQVEPSITTSWYAKAGDDHATKNRAEYCKLLAQDLDSIFVAARGPRETTNQSSVLVSSPTGKSAYRGASRGGPAVHFNLSPIKTDYAGHSVYSICGRKIMSGAKTAGIKIMLPKESVVRGK